MANQFSDVPKGNVYENMEVIVFNPGLPDINNATSVPMNLFTKCREVDASSDFNFTVPAKKRLVHVAIQTQHDQPMLLVLRKAGEDISDFNLEPGGEPWDIEYGKTVWTNTVFNIVGINGPVKILIDIK